MAPLRLVADANVLIAAFLRDSTVRRIITLSGIELYAPEYVFEEFRRHASELVARSGLPLEEAVELLDLLAHHFILLPAEDVRTHMEEALELMRDVDERDAPYLAAAMAVECEGIWSDDPHLTSQDVVSIWTTEAVVRKVRELGLPG